MTEQADCINSEVHGLRATTANRKNRCKVDLDKLLSDVDLDEMLRLYDEAAEELMQVAISDGHFADRNPS